MFFSFPTSFLLTFKVLFNKIISELLLIKLAFSLGDILFIELLKEYFSDYLTIDYYNFFFKPSFSFYLLFDQLLMKLKLTI